MISLEEALAAYPRHLRRLAAETLPVTQALNHVLVESLVSAADLPRFDQSAMDGYALLAADTQGAGPIRLPVAGVMAAGAHGELAALPAGTAARIFTGAPIPPGADTVIPQERVSHEDGQLIFAEAWPADRNIRRLGEELHRGAPLAAAGQRVSPGLIASLVNAGVHRVRATRKPRIRLLVSGDELQPVGAELKPGEIYDSNGPLVRAVLQRWGYEPPQVEHVDDKPEAVRAALSRALDESDLVLSTGGASVGDRDFLPATAESLGVRRIFWRVAQKPAKPLFFGMRDDSAAMLALPGNPGAVLVSLCLHVRRALDCMEGAAEPGPRWGWGRLAAPIKPDAQRVGLLRMRLDIGEDGVAMLSPLPKQDSHMLSNLSAAEVLVWVPTGEEMVAAGTALRWILLPF
jgi:molybdopterin molybdotransferase